jgi:hypothetical protein
VQSSNIPNQYFVPPNVVDFTLLISIKNLSPGIELLGFNSLFTGACFALPIPQNSHGPFFL